MFFSLLKVIRPTFGLLGSDTAPKLAGARRVTTNEAARELASSPLEPRRPQERAVDPMVAVYEARVETFHIAVAAILRVSSLIAASVRRVVGSVHARQVERVAIPE